MRLGDRLEFRNLRCTRREVENARLRDGSEITRWHYWFAGVDGRVYRYRGQYLFRIEAGCYFDCLATVARIWRNEVTIKRPKRLEPIATLRLI